MNEFLVYRSKNFLRWLRAQQIRHSAKLAAKFGGFLTMHGELEATLLRNGLRPLNLGLLSARSVTTAGVNFMASDFNDGASDINLFDYHDAGTGTNAEAIGDTALQTPWGGARIVGTPSNPAANQYRTIATITFTGTFAITEHGLFSASSGVTLWDRSVFAAINVVNTDAIQFTYTLTITAGG